ncbi:Nuclear protein localization protein 4 like protein, partial [Dictyocoela roeselum]
GWHREKKSGTTTISARMGSVHGSRIDKFIPSEYFIVKPTQGYRENPVFRDCRSVGALSKKKIWQYFEGDYTFSRFANFSLLFRIYKDSNAQEFQKDASLEDTLGFKENFKMKTADLDLLVDSVMKNDELEFTKFQLSDSYGRIKKMLDRYSDSWTCSRCTFINKSNLNECEMCMLPRY